ncbi:MAG: IS5/IS1182 family transposase, partial [Gammaproteobacteria bacterium]|nr:IS5/IS1182 family transposase [Gammaproteobacteria bacterium]
MSKLISGENRGQSTLFPDCLDDYISQENPVRVIDVFIDGLDLNNLGFKTIAANT